MVKIPETFNLGEYETENLEDMLIIIQRMYMDLAEAVNRKPDIIQRQVDGAVTDTFLSNGDININLSTNKVEMLTNHPTVSTVTWTTLS